MSKPIISVEHLSKYYEISHQKRGVDTFVESATAFGKGLIERIRHPFSPNRVHVDLEEFHALDDVSFEIEQGDRVGIIGRNGAGKSTLLKLLSRITEPTRGRIIMRGRVASLLEVGTGFHPELSGRENIYLNGAILGMKRTEVKAKFDEIVDFSGVEKFLDTPVKRYSSGMYVRLAFAVAAHLEPEILLIDEVLAVGDSEFQKKCVGKMDAIAKNEGRTILFVSHNMGLIKQLCNRGIWLNNGTIYQEDHTAPLLQAYFDMMESCLNFPLQRYGDEFLNFTDAQILNHSRNNLLSIHEPVFIQMRFQVKKKINFIPVPTLRLFSKDGLLLFTAYAYNCQILAPGNYSITFEIPPETLNDLEYYVTLYIWRADGENRNCFKVDHALKFSMIDPLGSSINRYTYAGRIPGEIRIPLKTILVKTD